MTPNADTHWIFVRGLARESRHWGSFPEEFARALANSGNSARVDGLDLPGTGRFSEMRSPLTIYEITTFVREKFLELRRRMRERGEIPPPKVYAVAISLGAMVVCDWMERWPDDFAGVVFINTSFKGFSPPHRRLTPEAIVHIVNIMRASDPVERERRVLKMTSNRPELHEEIAKEWARLGLERPTTPENFARQLTAAALFAPKLPKPQQPVLLLNGAGDRMVHPSCSKEIAARWGATLVQHPTAGHDLTVDDGPFATKEIIRWYESLQG
jgi:pimeloyl-ACP methyl ester carboxylesterase